MTLEHTSEKKYGKLYYDAEAFLPLLTYDHGNKADLDAKLATLHKILENGSSKKGNGRQLMIYGQFVYKKIYVEMGPALILWLKLAIEQQYRRRKVQVTDTILGDWLGTSRASIIKYKNILRKLDLLNVNNSKKTQKLSVNFFPPKPQPSS